MLENPKVGFEIQNIDLSTPLADEQFKKKILDPLYAHSAIVIRNQNLSPDQLVEFSAQFGRLEVHVFSQHLLSGHPEILHLSNIEEDNKPIGRPNPGEFWHTDLTYTESPNRISILYSVEIPRSETGVALGNTLFRSTIAAYNSLPPDMKEKLQGLRAKHFHLWIRRRHGDEDGIELTDEQRKRMQNVTHPIVCETPERKQKYLFVNSAHTVGVDGMAPNESDSLLDYLYAHIARQETYVHRWQVGDIVIWDNFTSQHFATLDYALPQRRRMWRLSVAGERPQAAR